MRVTHICHALAKLAHICYMTYSYVWHYRQVSYSHEIYQAPDGFFYFAVLWTKDLPQHFVSSNGIHFFQICQALLEFQAAIHPPGIWYSRQLRSRFNRKICQPEDAVQPTNMFVVVHWCSLNLKGGNRHGQWEVLEVYEIDLNRGYSLEERKKLGWSRLCMYQDTQRERDRFSEKKCQKKQDRNCTYLYTLWMFVFVYSICCVHVLAYFHCLNLMFWSQCPFLVPVVSCMCLCSAASVLCFADLLLVLPWSILHPSVILKQRCILVANLSILKVKPLNFLLPYFSSLYYILIIRALRMLHSYTCTRWGKPPDPSDQKWLEMVQEPRGVNFKLWVIKSRSCFRHSPRSHVGDVLWNSEPDSRRSQD